MVWSPALHKTVLFGGRAFMKPEGGISLAKHGAPYPENLAVGLLNDTWMYDGASWQAVQVGTPPPPREGAQLVSDPRRGVVVLVGGHTDDETAPELDRLGIWEFDGVGWTQKLAPADPSQPASIRTRRGASAFYNPLRGRVTVLGGTVDKLDFCTLSDATIAQQLAATSNDPAGRRALQATGCLGGVVHDAWEWDGTALDKVTDVVFGGVVEQQPVFQQVAGAAAWSAGAAPGEDGGAGSVSPGSAMLSYRYDRSGRHYPLRSQLERAHVPADAGAPPPPPAQGAEVAATGAAVSPLFAARVHPEVVFDPSRGVATVFAPDTGDIYDTDGASWTVRTPARTPFSNGPNDFLGAVWDSIAQRVVAFDPRDGSTWAYTDAAGWAVLTTSGPGAWGVDPSVHAKRDFVRTPAEKNEGTEAAAFVAALPKMPRMVFDRMRGRVVMLYGQATWEFDGASWSQFPFPPTWSACPAAPLAAFDGARGRTVAFGCTVPAQTWEWDGAQWTGPGPTPYTAAIERRFTGMMFPLSDMYPVPGETLYDWYGSLQLAWAHPNAAFESPALGGVSTLDADGTARTWNGTTWIAGPKIASQSACAKSGWDPSAGDDPNLDNDLGNGPWLTRWAGTPSEGYWLGREFLPTCFSPPAIEDSSHARLLAFRDGPLGLLELPLGDPPALRAWRFPRLGTEGYFPNNPNVAGTLVQPNPYPFELMAPETVHLLTQSDPATRTGVFGTGYSQDSPDEQVVQSLWWPYRVLVDPSSQRVRLLTSRGMLWELTGETVHGLGDACTNDLDCGDGFCGTQGVCCDLGTYCTQQMCMTCLGATPGVCSAIPAGQPDLSGLCGTGPCTGTCPGTPHATACSYDPTKACGSASACVDGTITASGHCSATDGTCLLPGSPLPACQIVNGTPDFSRPCVITSLQCPNNAGCAGPTSCKTGACSQRTDCNRYTTCDTTSGTCVPDPVSQAAGQLGSTPAKVLPPPRLTNEAIAAQLADAGFSSDDAGRFFISGPDDTNTTLGLTFDPNLRTPALSFKACVEYILSCVMLNGDVDSCVAQAPRCVSSTPWNGDPAGIECCPQACLLKYFSSRPATAPAAAMQSVAASTCYLPPDGGTQ
jgi:hypothetical protein